MPIIVTAIIGFNINLEKPRFNFMFFLNAVNAIVNAIMWQTTEAIAAPLTPIDGIGTKIKFNISLATTPTP